jgi:hypothetical protein
LLLVENGRADPSYGDLVNLAQILRTDVEALVVDEGATTGRHDKRTAASVAVQPHANLGSEGGMMGVDGWQPDADPWLEDLRRRGFLRAGLVAGGAAAFSLWLPSLRTDSEGREAVARRLLHFAPEIVNDPPNLKSLRQSIHAARIDLQQSRYSPVLSTVPSLLIQARTAVQELSGTERAESQQLLAQTYRLIFNVLRKVGDTNLATIAADRGMQAACASGDPAAVADATGCLGVMLSDGGHHAQAIELCSGVASDVGRDNRRTADSSMQSVYGQLLLSGAEAAAQSGDRGLSDDFYREAGGVADRLGADGNHSFTAFGPTNVMVHRVHAAIVLGDGEYALRIAQGVDLASLPVLERRAHHLLDVAIGYGLVEKSDLALNTLLTAEQLAPEEVRLDARARMLVHDLVQRMRRHTTHLAEFAQRMRT